MSTITLADIVARAGSLPVLPEVALSTVRATESQDSRATDIAANLNRDPILAAKVLRLANSAFYGLPRRVSDTTEAVILLGLQTVRSLCLLAATYPLLARDLKGYDVTSAEIWNHSFFVAQAAQLIAERTNTAPKEKAFTAGLLHDLGKVTLNGWINGKLFGMVDLAQSKNVSFDDIERMVLGHDHAEVGAYVTESWNLPVDIVEAIRFQHHPDSSLDHRLADIVHVADYFALLLGIGIGGDGMNYLFDDTAPDRIQLDCSAFDCLLDEATKFLFDGSSALAEMAA